MASYSVHRAKDSNQFQYCHLNIWIADFRYRCIIVGDILEAKYLYNSALASVQLPMELL